MGYTLIYRPLSYPFRSLGSFDTKKCDIILVAAPIANKLIYKLNVLKSYIRNGNSIGFVVFGILTKTNNLKIFLYIIS